jgi:HIV Tat-specific factor 1
MEDNDGHPKVKMYADEYGNFNGEALVVYFMEDSVRLAESILDEAELRVGDPTTRMRVRQGEFGHKQGEGEGGEVKRRVVDRKKATQRIVKMKKYVALFPLFSCKTKIKDMFTYSKVSDWDFEDGFGPAEDPVEEKRPLVSRVAVLKHMFTLQELKGDPSLLLDLKEDVREEAENLGDVTNVVLYDVRSNFSRQDVGLTCLQLEPEGVITVKFRDPISAQACVLVRFLLFRPWKRSILTNGMCGRK